MQTLEIVKDRESWLDAAYWVAKNRTRLSDGTTTIITVDSILISNFIFTDLILTSKMLIFLTPRILLRVTLNIF